MPVTAVRGSNCHPRTPCSQQEKPTSLRDTCKAIQGPAVAGNLVLDIDAGHRQMSTTSASCKAPTHPCTTLPCRAILELLRRDIKPRDIMTRKAFENAIVTVMALGGSTNAVLHLLAMAHAVDVPLTLDDFQTISDRTPFIADLKPSGRYVMEDLHKVGRAGASPCKDRGGAQMHVGSPLGAASTGCVQGRLHDCRCSIGISVRQSHIGCENDCHTDSNGAPILAAVASPAPELTPR